MSDSLTRRSFELFKRAVAIDANERAAFVLDSCGDDTSLRRRVETLVAAIDRSGDFLEPTGPAGARTAPSPALGPGDVVGGYEITAVIGAGGMGTVYEAMQQRPRRRVALKVMQGGVATRESRRRFEFEVEILARLRHPAIAQIYESGTYDDGTGAGSVPWFAMEHIANAESITTYARTRELARPARVALFAAVCDAVQHGHQKGVIHRDLKPGNILVDANGQPKVIDFGIARLVDRARGSITVDTNAGHLIGTLNYMSPEQCGPGAADLDLRADVYALGVVLYELLCGTLPHALDRVPVVEAMRIIQTESPPRPAALDRTLRGGLEAIVLKAIDKDRERRYSSAGGLGRDLRRFLEDEMIEARPMTLLYQLQLFTRRHRRFIAAAAVVAFAIVAGAVASLSFAVQAGAESTRRHRAEVAALRERDTARWQAYVANIGAAFYAYEAGEFQWMRARLGVAPASLRGWEWRFLSALAEPSADRFVAHEDMVFGMDMTPDGRRLATASRDGTIRIWDAADHTLIATGVGHETWVFEVAFSPDGRRVVSSSQDGTARVWDAATGEPLLVFRDHGAPVSGVDWGQRGEIASAATDGVVWLWDGTTGATITRFQTAAGGQSDVSFSNDGRRLAAWGPGTTVAVRDVATLAVEREFAAPDDVKAVAWRGDDRQIAVATADIARVWDADTGEFRHEVTYDSSVPRAMTFFGGGRFLAAGVGRAIVVWDLQAGGREVRLLGHEESVAGICVGPDPRRVYSASWDRTVRVWDRAAAGAVRVLRGHEASVLSARFSPDGETVASASDDGTVRLWSASDGTPVRTIRAHDEPVRAMAFSRDGVSLATASHDGTARMWEAATGRLITTLAGHAGRVGAVAFDPTGAWLATGSSDTTIRLWDVASWTTVFVLAGHTARINGLAFSPDGRTVASASRDSTIRIWDVATGAAVFTLTGHASDAFDVVFSHDGRRLYSGGRDQTVRVWDTATGAEVQVLAGHGQFISCLALSPDGTRLAGGSWFEKIILWDVATGDHVATLTGHEDAIRSVAFDPSGRRIVSGSYDKTVRIWDSAPRRGESAPIPSASATAPARSRGSACRPGA